MFCTITLGAAQNYVFWRISSTICNSLSMINVIIICKKIFAPKAKKLLFTKALKDIKIINTPLNIHSLSALVVTTSPSFFRRPFSELFSNFFYFASVIFQFFFIKFGRIFLELFNASSSMMVATKFGVLVLPLPAGFCVFFFIRLIIFLSITLEAQFARTSSPCFAVFNFRSKFRNGAFRLTHFAEMSFVTYNVHAYLLVRRARDGCTRVT